MDYSEAREYVRLQMLHYRRMERVINGPIFERACELADEEQLNFLEKAVVTMNAASIRRWCKPIFKKTIEDYTIPQLRQMARRYNIECWHLMDKTNLIEAIENAKQRYNFEGTDPVALGDVPLGAGEEPNEGEIERRGEIESQRGVDNEDSSGI